MQPLSKAVKANISVHLGLINFSGSVHSVRAEESGNDLVRICQGLETKHAPSRIGRTDACKACGNVHVSTFTKGRQVGDSYVVLERDELDELAELSGPTRKEIALKAHPKAEMASVVAGEKLYYLSPGGNPANYALMAELLRQRPDVELVGEFTIRTEPSVYALRLLGGVLVLQELARPGVVREAPAVNAEFKQRDLDAALGYVDTVIEPYDPEAYGSARSARIEELLADRTPVGVEAASGGADLFELLTAATKKATPAKRPAKKVAPPMRPVRPVRQMPAKVAAKKSAPAKVSTVA